VRTLLSRSAPSPATAQREGGDANDQDQESQDPGGCHAEPEDQDERAERDPEHDVYEREASSAGGSRGIPAATDR
jgi:hypothetical protein